MAAGYTVIGKNVVENRNIGISASCTRSKCCQERMNVVHAMPTAANENATSNAAGRASSAHAEAIRPIASMTVRKPKAYIPPRNNAHAISPIRSEEHTSELQSH